MKEKDLRNKNEESLLIKQIYEQIQKIANGDVCNQLRELLQTPYPYDSSDGNTQYTLQEVFYRLYDEYVSAEQAWSKKQEKKKEELRKLYPDTSSEEDNARYHDAYQQWYETVARNETVRLNEKRSKVLSIFCPNDISRFQQMEEQRNQR